jgi:hypothetical protein
MKLDLVLDPILSRFAIVDPSKSLKPKRFFSLLCD